MALCFAMGVLEGFDIQVVGVAAPRMAADLGLGAAALTLVFFASNVGLLIGASVGGWLADRCGRRPVIIGAAVMFGCFTLTTGFASAAPALVAARFLAGCGLGAALPNMVAVASDISLPERRGRTTSLMFCGVPLGGALVALISQSATGIAWQSLFIVGGGLPLLLAAVQLRYLPETGPSARASVATVPVRSVLFGEGRWRTTILLWLVVAPTLMAVYLILYWLPTLLGQNGFSPGVAAQAAATFNLCGVAGAIVIGWLVDRNGIRIVCGMGYVAFAAVAILLSHAGGRADVLALSGAAGFLILGLNYAVYGLASDCYPRPMIATGTGVALSVGRLGSVLGPTLSGALFVGGVSPTGILQLLAPIGVAAAVAVVRLDTIQGSAVRRR